MSRRPVPLTVRATFAMVVTIALAAAIAITVAPSSVSADANEGVPGAPRRSASVIASGEDFTCVRLANGTVKCWGEGSEGRLGQGSTADIGNAPGQMGDNLAPIDLGTGRTATAITAGSSHACALLDNGTVKCWGENNLGQLGQGNTTNIGDAPGQMGDNLLPIDLGTGRTATAITAGDDHTCALLDNGTVKCWGSGGDGLGQGSTADIGTGLNQMGDNLNPIDLGTGRTATAVAAGGRTSCALLDNGTVKCWGYGGLGQLGQGTTSTIGDDPGEMGDNLPPIDLGTGRTATAITAGFEHTCALLDNGTVKCWGENIRGPLGQGNTATIGNAPDQMGDNLPPIDLGTGRTATAITAGFERHTCALLDNGTVKCWGDNGHGQLGQGSTDHIGDAPGEMGNNLNAVDLGPGRTARAVTGGSRHTCALLDNGTVKCWGRGTRGQLAQGNTNNIGDGIGTSVADTPAIDLGSGAGNLVMPLMVPPTAPLGLAAVAGIESAALSWSAPSDDGSAPITGHRIQSSTGGSPWTTQIADTGSSSTTRTITKLSANEPVRFRVAAINSAGVGAWSAPTAPITPGASYLPLDPARLLDTRPGGETTDMQFTPGVKLVGGEEIALQITGRGNVPAGADAVVLNVTVNDPDQPGFITAYPCGTPRPNASNLNYVAGQTIPNTVISKIGAGGQVCLYSDQTTHLLADVNGAFPADSSYIPLDPARLLDTRPGGETTDNQATPGIKLVGGEEIALQVTGRGNVPTGADAVVLNVTVNEPDLPGFITAYPCGTPRPNASNLNYVAGQTIPNTVISKIGAGGQVCLYSDQTTHLLADVNGAFPADSSYIPLDPARLLDTRPGGQTTDNQATPGIKLIGGEEIALQVTGRGNVPTGADAVVLNVTVNEPDNPGFITAYPCGTTRPNASNLNYVAGQTIPNTVISKIGAGGQVCLYSDQTTHLLADVNGSF